MQTAFGVPGSAKRNIQTIAELEQRLRDKRSLTERVGEAVARFFGSMTFIAAQVIFVSCWIMANRSSVAAIHTFDPYPFALLTLALSIEFIFLTTFVLINQKHQIRRDEQWSHLHLQLSMLTEQEVTKSIRTLGLICRHLGVEQATNDEELTEMTKPTSVHAVAGELEKRRDVGAQPDQTAAAQ